MPKPVEGQSPYNAGLDGVRAIAVLGVIAYHLRMSWAAGGLLGVAVFFVLSGYLITDLLLAESRRRSTISVRRFWLRRARRLLPALFAMLFFAVAWATLFDRSQLPGMRSDLLPAIFYYSNWWGIFQHLPYFAGYGPLAPFSHLWSLAVEEQFYLVWPLVMLAVVKLAWSRRALVIGIVVAAAGSAVEMGLLYSPYANPTRVYEGTDTRAFALLIGAALAVVWPRDRKFTPLTERGRRVLDSVGAAAVVGILVFFWRAGQFDAFVYRGGMVLLSVATAVLIAVCVHPGARLARVLGVTPLRWVGERSYGIYLWQVPVIALSFRGATPLALWRQAFQVVVIMVVAAASWRWIEEPVRHGALGRVWSAIRRGGWLAVRPDDRRGWIFFGGGAVFSLVCLLGLTGAVSGALDGSGPEHSVLPPPHHTLSTSATTTMGPPTTSAATTTTAPSGQGVTAIGDSVMVDAATDLEALLPGIVIDAVVGQQLTQVQADVPTLKSEGDIGDELILGLGTNGYYTVTQLETLLKTLGPMKRVVLINTRETRAWEQSVNQTIATVAKVWPSTTLVDWYYASANQPQYFYPDGVHLNPTGAKAYAAMVVQALESPPPTTTTTTSPPATTTTTGSSNKRTSKDGTGSKGARSKGSGTTTTSAPWFPLIG